MTVEKMMTRKECILAAETFVRSAMKGISVLPVETLRIGQTFLASSVHSPLSAEDFEGKDFDQEMFKRRPATRREMNDADKLIEVMRTAGLTQRQARILFLRSYHKLPWKVLAEKFDTSWDHARRLYDDALHVIYYKAGL